MLHNLLTTPAEVYIVYDIDFIPMSDPGAKAIKPAHPVWNDVQRGQIYPVFDVIKGDGGKDGVYTYPDDADNPYGEGPKKNEWVVPEDMTLVATGGHLHPGGIHTDMYVTRNGKKVRIFQSKAIYYEPAGAVSWDVSMTVTPEDWMVRVKKGDVISISATYDTTRASWYESMGIMVLWETSEPGEDGRDPFTVDVSKTKDYVTHGPLPENRNHGGEKTDEFVDATELPDGKAADKVTIADFTYGPGDIGGIYDERADRQGRPGPDLLQRRPGPHAERGVAHDHVLQGAVRQGDRHRLSPRRLGHPVRLRRAGHERSSDRWTPGLDDPEESADGHVYVLLSNPPIDARRVPRDRLTLLVIDGFRLAEEQRCPRT